MNRRLRLSPRAQSLLEFALVIPLIMLIVIGLFDLGYSVFVNNMLSNAAREGARAGIIRSTPDSTIRLRVNNSAPGLALPDSQIQIQPATRTFGNPITVTVTYTYVPLTPMIARITGGGLPLSSTSVMIVEGVTPVGQ